jgi:hypothetical protein
MIGVIAMDKIFFSSSNRVVMLKQIDFAAPGADFFVNLFRARLRFCRSEFRPKASCQPPALDARAACRTISETGAS